MATIKVGIDVSDNGTAKKATDAAERLKKAYDAAGASAKNIGTGTASGGSQAGMSAQARAASSAELVEYNRQRAIAQGTGASARDFAKQSEGLGGLVRLYATFAANVFAVTAAFGALSRAMDTTNMIKGLDQLGAASGQALGGLSKRFVEVTDGAISLRESVEAVAKASAAGLTSKQILQIGDNAKKASQALGVDMSDAVSRLTRGITKLEPELLDELGIYTKLEESVNKYALSVGKSAGTLTDFERRQAFAVAVLDEANRKFGAIELDTNPYNKLLATFRDVAQTGLELVNTVLAPIVGLLSQSPVALAGILALIGKSLLTSALPALGEFRKGLDDQVKSSKEILEIAQKRRAAHRTYISELEAEKIGVADRTSAEKAALAVEQARAQFSKGRTRPAVLAALPTAAELKSTELNQQDLDALQAKNKEIQKRISIINSEKPVQQEAIDKRKEELRVLQAANIAINERIQSAKNLNKILGESIVGTPGRLSKVAQDQRELDKATRAARGIELVQEVAQTYDTSGFREGFNKLGEAIKTNRKELGLFQAGMVGVRGAGVLLAGGLNQIMGVLGPIGMAAGLATTTFALLDSWFSKNSKQAEEASKSFELVDEALKTIDKTAEAILKKDPLSRFSASSLVASAKSVNELTTSLEDLIEKVEAQDKAANIWDKFVNGFKGLWGGDVITQSSDRLTQSISKLLKAASGPEGEEATKNLKELVGVDPKDEQAFRRALTETPGKFLELAPKVAKEAQNLSNKLTSVAGSAQQTNDDLDNANKSLTEFITSSLSSDKLSKFGIELVKSGNSIKNSLKDTRTEFALLEKLLKNPESLKLFSKGFQDSFLENRNSIQANITVIQAYRAEIEKLQKVRAPVVPMTEGPGGAAFGVYRGMGRRETLAKQQVVPEALAVINVLEKAIEERTTSMRDRLAGEADEMVKKGVNLLKNATNELLQKAAATLSLARVELLGNTEEAIRERTRIENEGLDLQINTLLTQKDLIGSQDTLQQKIALQTVATEELSAVMKASTLQDESAKQVAISQAGDVASRARQEILEPANKSLVQQAQEQIDAQIAGLRNQQQANILKQQGQIIDLNTSKQEEFLDVLIRQEESTRDRLVLENSLRNVITDQQLKAVEDSNYRITVFKNRKEQLQIERDSLKLELARKGVRESSAKAEKDITAAEALKERLQKEAFQSLGQEIEKPPKELLDKQTNASLRLQAVRKTIQVFEREINDRKNTEDEVEIFKTKLETAKGLLKDYKAELDSIDSSIEDLIAKSIQNRDTQIQGLTQVIQNLDVFIQTKRDEIRKSSTTGSERELAQRQQNLLDIQAAEQRKLDSETTLRRLENQKVQGEKAKEQIEKLAGLENRATQLVFEEKVEKIKTLEKLAGVSAETQIKRQAALERAQEDQSLKNRLRSLDKERKKEIEDLQDRQRAAQTFGLDSEVSAYQKLIDTTNAQYDAIKAGEEAVSKARKDGITALEQQNLLLESQNKLVKALEDAAAASTGAFKSLFTVFATLQKQEIDFTQKSTALTRTKAAEQEQAGIDYYNNEKELKRQLFLIDKKYNNLSTKLQTENVQKQLGATKSLFKEKTVAYKVFSSLEKAAAAQTLVLNLQTTASNIASLAGRVATGAAQMFAQGGFAGFAGVGAMLTLLSSLGIFKKSAKVSAGPSTEDIQKAQLTGQVFQNNQLVTARGALQADPTATLKSIDESLEIIKNNGFQDLNFSNGSVDYLEKIEKNTRGLSETLALSISGISAGVNTGVVTPGPFGNFGKVGGLAAGVAGAGLVSIGAGAVALGIQPLLSAIVPSFASGILGVIGGPLGIAAGFLFGKNLDKILNSIFGGKTTQTLKDFGITAEGTVDSLSNATTALVETYTTVQTTIKGGLFRRTRVFDKTEAQKASDEITEYISFLFSDIKNSFLVAGNTLGRDVTSTLQDYVIQPISISTKDLKPEEIAQAIKNKLSLVFNEITLQAFGPLIEALRDPLEEAGTTLTRLAKQTLIFSDSMLLLGKNVRDITGTLRTVIADDLVRAFDGLENYQDRINFFRENFLTEAEKIAPVSQKLTEALQQLGISGSITREEYKALVLQQDLSTVSGRATFTALLNLGEAFNKVTDFAEKAKEKLDGFSTTIRNFIKDQTLQIGTSSQRLGYLLQEFQTTVQKSLQGDEKSLNYLTDIAGRTIESARSTARTTREFNLLRAGVVSSLADVATQIETGNVKIVTPQEQANIILEKIQQNTSTLPEDLAQVLARQIDTSVATTLTKASNTSTSIIPAAPVAESGYDYSGPPGANALGAAYFKGMKMFASGGAFTNSVVSNATMFPLGVMGEAGPEAIMPLTRMGDGSLGVTAEVPQSNMNRFNAALLQEVKELRKEMEKVRAATEVSATGTNKTYRLLDRVTENGDALNVVVVTA